MIAKTNEAAPLSDPSKPKTIAALDPPSDRTNSNVPEYATSQIARLLKLDTEAADSEAALSCRAKREFQEDLRYCGAFGWLHWDGKKWQTDARNHAATLAKFVTLSRVAQNEVRYLRDLAAGLEKTGRTEDFAAMKRAAARHQRHIKMVESERFAKAAMVLAQEAFTVETEVFQPRPWLLGFESGVWDKGEWRGHIREDYFRSLSPVPVSPADIQAAREAGPVGADEWGAVLERITRGDHDYARTLQDVAGNAFSGTGSLRLLCWAYGASGTGKSTYAELMSTALGEAAASVDTKLLGAEGSRERLGVSIYGKRLAVVAEAGNQRIDAELLKTLSGSDRYPICFKYHEPFTANPTHALLMVANSAPTMNAYDNALRERVLALPFTHRLLGDDPDNPQTIPLSSEGDIETVRRNPQSRLVREFTAWALVGMENVLAFGNVFRAKVTVATTGDFWKGVDKLTPFWESVSEEELRTGITRLRLRSLYDEWCREEGERRPLSPQNFTKACDSVGLKPYKPGGQRSWYLETTWPFADTSDTSEPTSDKPSRVREEPIVEGFCENSSPSVRSVRAASNFAVWLKTAGPTDGPASRRKLLELGCDSAEAEAILNNLQPHPL